MLLEKNLVLLEIIVRGFSKDSSSSDKHLHSADPIDSKWCDFEVEILGRTSPIFVGSGTEDSWTGDR